MRTKRGFICGMKTNSVVKIDQAIMGGEPCFAGTRVPARTLIDYLEGGDTIDQFLEDFPTVRAFSVIVWPQMWRRFSTAMPNT